MKKYIRVCSDLHLEFHVRQERGFTSLGCALESMLPPDERDKTSLLIMAGDIHTSWPALVEVYKLLSQRFHRVVHVPGNHEFYRNDFSKWNSFQRDTYGILAKLNIYNVSICATNAVKLIQHSRSLPDNFILLATTLWTKGPLNPLEELSLRECNDFYMIDNGDTKWSVEDMKLTNSIESAMLSSALAHFKDYKKIVVTHHLPSLSLIDPRFSYSSINGLFASNFDDMLSGPHAPDIWVCGHTHRHIEQKVGDTMVYCNPCGYPGEDTDYIPSFFVDLEGYGC